ATKYTSPCSLPLSNQVGEGRDIPSNAPVSPFLWLPVTKDRGWDKGKTRAGTDARSRYAGDSSGKRDDDRDLWRVGGSDRAQADPGAVYAVPFGAAAGPDPHRRHVAHGLHARGVPRPPAGVRGGAVGRRLRGGGVGRVRGAHLVPARQLDHARRL